MQSSRAAAKLVYKEKATEYRAEVIREYAKEYLSTGSISLGAHGKHSKRVSVLDDNDIKMKAVKWFRSQPKAKRSIPALVKHLREEILPQAVGDDTLSEERLVDGSAVSQLSAESVRRKLIFWGFAFKRLGK